jgi:hypothetical protein
VLALESLKTLFEVEQSVQGVTDFRIKSPDGPAIVDLQEFNQSLRLRCGCQPIRLGASVNRLGDPASTCRHFSPGEWIDSVSFGPPAVDFQDTETALSSALSTYSTLLDDSRARIRMLLRRYTEIMNLPYVHERVEGLWRIVEALVRRFRKIDALKCPRTRFVLLPAIADTPENAREF